MQTTSDFEASMRRDPPRSAPSPVEIAAECRAIREAWDLNEIIARDIGRPEDVVELLQRRVAISQKARLDR